MTTKRKRRGPNKSLLRRVAARLRRLRHPQHYNQAVYAEKTECGTAACIAGHTVVEAGYILEVRNVGDLTFWCYRAGQKKKLKDIAVTAMKLLRLTSSQAGKLFAPRPPERWPDRLARRWWFARRWWEDKENIVAADLLDALADGKVRL